MARENFFAQWINKLMRADLWWGPVAEDLLTMVGLSRCFYGDTPWVGCLLTYTMLFSRINTLNPPASSEKRV